MRCDGGGTTGPARRRRATLRGVRASRSAQHLVPSQWPVGEGHRCGGDEGSHQPAVDTLHVLSRAREPRWHCFPVPLQRARRRLSALPRAGMQNSSRQPASTPMPSSISSTRVPIARRSERSHICRPLGRQCAMCVWRPHIAFVPGASHDVRHVQPAATAEIYRCHCRRRAGGPHSNSARAYSAHRFLRAAQPSAPPAVSCA